MVKFEEVLKKKGFDSVKQYHRMVSNVDLTSMENLIAFNLWKEIDGTKNGLINL